MTVIADERISSVLETAQGVLAPVVGVALGHDLRLVVGGEDAERTGDPGRARDHDDRRGHADHARRDARHERGERFEVSRHTARAALACRGA